MSLELSEFNSRRGLQTEYNGDQAPWSIYQASKQTWKPLLNLYRFRHNMLVQMISFLLLGLFGALGHHLYYQSLHNQLVQDSEWPIRFGTGVAFFVKAFLIASVEVAYHQQAWLMVKKRDFKVSTLDFIFSACTSPFGFANYRFVSEAYVAAIIALFVWLLPLSAVASPSALTVREDDRSHPTTCDDIPTIDLARENGFGLDSTEDQDRAGMSYWQDIRSDKLLTYTSPSPELERIFKLSILTYTGPLQPLNPCASVKACTYDMDIAMPFYSCQRRDEFGGNNRLGYKKSQLNVHGIEYASYSSFDEDEYGAPLTWSTMPPSAPDLGSFTEIPSLWIGWIGDKDQYQPHIVECLLYNATVSFNVEFSRQGMSINHKGVNLVSLLLPHGSKKIPSDEDYQEFAGYHAASYLYRAFLSGNITWDPIGGSIGTTQALQTIWFGAGITWEPNLATTIEDTFRDLFVSMISNTLLHSQIN